MMSHEVVGHRSQGGGRDETSRRRSHGFSLLELLIVIGIIALLLTAVFTAVAKVRSAAKRTQCLANLKSIGAAMHQYLIDNNDTFPQAASNKAAQSGDWISWQSIAAPAPQNSMFWIDLVGSTGIGKYISALDDLSPGGLQSLRCPADDRLELGGFLNTSPQQTQSHTAYKPGYPFSYVISAFMVSGNRPDNGPDLSTIARTFTKVRDASSKIMVYEEDPRTINDGVGSLQPTTTPPTNLLSVRHDLHEPLDPASTDPDAPIRVTIFGGPPPALVSMNHMQSSGNVLFADGHAESVSRAFAHVKAHYAPDPDAAALAGMP